mmetsp:Transcript_15949/g.33696  ORF Transcript_15949/g.33696 Transcript_15949/m.33696 type:complete len:151 (-) Transcript_15949:63-515(-)
MPYQIADCIRTQRGESLYNIGDFAKVLSCRPVGLKCSPEFDVQVALEDVILVVYWCRGDDVWSSSSSRMSSVMSRNDGDFFFGQRSGVAPGDGGHARGGGRWKEGVCSAIEKVEYGEDVTWLHRYFDFITRRNFGPEGPFTSSPSDKAKD